MVFMDMANIGEAIPVIPDRKTNNHTSFAKYKLAARPRENRTSVMMNTGLRPILY